MIASYDGNDNPGFSLDTTAKVTETLRRNFATAGLATAYVCERFTCQQPVTEPAKLAQMLD